MKKILFICLVLLLGCKKDDPPAPQPQEPTGKLEVFYTGNETPEIYSSIRVSSNKFQFSEKTDTATSISHTITRDVPGDVGVNVNVTTKYKDGSPVVYGVYTLRVVFNGAELANETFPNNSNVFVSVSLPKI